VANEGEIVLEASSRFRRLNVGSSSSKVRRHASRWDERYKDDRGLNIHDGVGGSRISRGGFNTGQQWLVESLYSKISAQEGNTRRLLNRSRTRKRGKFKTRLRQDAAHSPIVVGLKVDGSVYGASEVLYN